MFKYANYAENHDPSNYSVGWDWYGPQYYAPSHCMKDFDYN